MTSRGMLTAASLPSRPRRRSRLHRQAEDTFLAGPLVGPFEQFVAINATQSRRPPGLPRSRCYHVRRRPPDQHTPFDQHCPTDRESGPAPRGTKPRDAAPEVRLQLTWSSRLTLSATSCVSPTGNGPRDDSQNCRHRSHPHHSLWRGSSNLSNAPVKPRAARRDACALLQAA